MASDRETAKGAVVQKDDDDPELDAALEAGARLQLDLKREDNRHTETMNQQNLGVVGKVFGDGRSLPTSMAFLALIAGVFGAGFCWYAAYTDSTNTDFWAKQAERSLGFAGLALGYILGQGTRP